MSNVLSNEQRQQILALGRLGWTLRRIEQATGSRRETVSAYLKAAGLAAGATGGKTGHFRGGVPRLGRSTPGVPTENLIRTVRVTDRADVGPANDGNVSIAAVHSVNVDEWLASFGRSSGRRAVCTVFRRRPSMAVVRPRDDGSCGAGRPRAASQ